MKLSKEVRDEIKIYQANDYDIKEETPEYVIMEKRTATFGGHILVFLFTFWWTWGIGNLLYWLFAKKTKKIIK
jgi:hypothetical protein